MRKKVTVSMRPAYREIVASIARQYGRGKTKEELRSQWELSSTDFNNITYRLEHAGLVFPHGGSTGKRVFTREIVKELKKTDPELFERKIAVLRI